MESTWLFEYWDVERKNRWREADVKTFEGGKLEIRSLCENEIEQAEINENSMYWANVI